MTLDQGGHAEKPHDTNGVLGYRAKIERPWNKHRQWESKTHAKKAGKREAQSEREGKGRVSKNAK
jgi:hypothetical protein